MQCLESRRSVLVHGDALRVLEELPDGSVDAVLTDPPYCSGGLTSCERRADPTAKYQTSKTVRTYPVMMRDSMDQRSWMTWCIWWLGECWRIARDGAPLMVFTDWRQMPALSDAVQMSGWRWLSTNCWHKPGARPNKGRFTQACEYILFASKGAFVAQTDRCLPGMYQYAVCGAKKVHLTGKPVALCEDLLAVTKEGGAVLDPYMGGCSTGVACMKTGRRFIGVELSPEYFAVSRERMEKTGEVYEESALEQCVTMDGYRKKEERS